MDIKEALDVLRPVARQAQAAQALHDALDTAVGLDGHKAEVEQQIAKLKAEAEQVQHDNAAATEQSKRDTAAAQDRASAYLNDAKQFAAKIKTDAVAEATKLVEDARAEAKTAQDTRDAAKDEYVSVSKDVAALVAEKDRLTAEVAALREQASRILA